MVFVLCGVSFCLFSSFCVYAGLLVVLQVVDFQEADFSVADLRWAELHYLGEFLFEPLG